MKPIIIFRFHKDAEHCERMLALLRRLNPGVPIHGVYGGTDTSKPWQNLFRKHLTTVLVSSKPAVWNWMNGDLLLREWYQSVGFGVPFDRLYFVEWDLLITQPLAQAYAHVGAEHMALTWYGPLNSVEHSWHWTLTEPSKTQWEYLLAFVRERYQYAGTPHRSAGPGVVLPRAFLEAYSRMDVPELAHEELRLPLYAELTGTLCLDTGFWPAGGSALGSEYFNCDSRAVTEDTVKSELAKPTGRRAFHPYRGMVNFI